MRKYSPGPPDSMVLKVTGAAGGLLLILLALAGGLTRLPMPAVIVLYSLSGVLALTLALGWLSRPTRYEVRSDSVAIVRLWPFSTIAIPLSGVKEVRHFKLSGAAPASLGLPWIFGYSGRFGGGELGVFLFFGTGVGEVVSIGAGETYVLSPENPKRFVRHVHDAMGK